MHRPNTSFVVAGLIELLAVRAHANPFELCRRGATPEVRIDACTEVIHHSSSRATLIRAYNIRGFAYCEAKKPDQAVADFTQVIAFDHSIAGYFDNRARALREAGRFDEAIRDSDRAIAMAPTYGFTYFGKAATLEKAGRAQESLQALASAEKLSPPNAGLYEFRGKLLGELGRFDEAYAAYDRSLALQPDRSSVFKTRAGTEEAQGRLREAIDDLNRFPSDKPDFAEVTAQRERLLGMLQSQEQPKHTASEAENACASVDTDKDRLACYDKAAGRPAPKIVAQAEPPSVAAQTDSAAITPAVSSGTNTLASLGLTDLPAMHDTYDKNQARFFRDYGGRHFSASMPLHGVVRNWLDKSTFDVTFGQSMLGDIHCSINDTATINFVTDKNKGDMLKVSGTIKDHTLGVVQLDDCKIAASE